MCSSTPHEAWRVSSIIFPSGRARRHQHYRIEQMSEIKSFAVGEGDMFYVNHGNDSCTIIDCCLDGDTDERILNEVDALRRLKSLTRFISTHPDEDHIGGLHLLDERIGIVNFYCVENKATKPDQTDSFDRYCELRDADKAFYLFQNCSRKWL